MLGKLRYVYSLCLRRQRQGHLSAPRQLAEIAWLQLTRGVGYAVYHYAGMWDRSATWDYKTSYLSQPDYLRAVYRVNERKYHGISQYKPIEKAYFRQFSIRTVDYLGTLHPQWGCTPDGKPLRDDADLAALLAGSPGRKFCCKPVEGANGKGFHAYRVLDARHAEQVRDLADGRALSFADLGARLLAESPDGWLLEQYIEQHPALQVFNPSSVNTIRMFLFRRKDGTVVQLGSFLKTGQPGALIDKTEGGGAAVFIDAKTGVLTDGFDWSPMMLPQERHPASGVSFRGVQIPYWQEAEALAIRALGCCPGTRFVGVDIAIAVDGPLMVEMNVQPDFDCLPVMRIPTAPLFDS